MFENVVHLKGLSQLKSLVLEDTQVTDAGLKRLKGLTQLKWLGLYNTKVIASSVKGLQSALPNCCIQAELQP